MIHKMQRTHMVVMLLLTIFGLGSLSFSFAQEGDVFDSPLPTPIAEPTATPPSEWAQKALGYVAERHGIPIESLLVVNEHQRSYPLSGRTFRAFTVLDIR